PNNNPMPNPAPNPNPAPMPVATYEVPSLVGMKKEAALQALGSKVVGKAIVSGAAPTRAQVGDVVSQQPQAGSNVAPGSTVTFYYFGPMSRRPDPNPNPPDPNNNNPPTPPNTQVSYWLGRKAGANDERIIYDVPVPAFFVAWMQESTSIGGGQTY